MFNHFNSIIIGWNLVKDIERIDKERSIFTYEKDIPVLHLYLKIEKHICPRCEASEFKVKGSETQKINTTLINHSYAIIYFHRRVYKCNNCSKKIKDELLSFTVHKERSFSLDLEILHSLKDIRLTYKQVSEMYHVSRTYVLDLFDKTIEMKRENLPEILSIDEKYAKKLTETKYCCILYSPVNKRIVDVIDSRRINALDEYFYNISSEERNTVKYYITDLNETYRTVHNRFFSKSIHAVDSFHVIMNLNKMVDNIRIKVMKEYAEVKSDSSSYWLLKKYYKYLLRNFDDIFDRNYYFKKFNMFLDKQRLIYEMIKESKELYTAYNLAQEYRYFNELYSYSDAKEKLEELIDLFLSEDSEEIKRFGYLLINWKEEIINSFIRVNDWRLSNGKTERDNKSIQTLFEISYGFSNFPRTRNRIMYSINTKNEERITFKKESKYSNKRIQKPRGNYNKNRGKSTPLK